MESYENGLEFIVANDYWYVSRRVDGLRFFDHFWMGR